MNKLPYKIYYADGSTFNGAPVDANGFGVVMILQGDQDGRFNIVHGAPYYMMTEEGCWLPAFENDIVDSLVHRLGEIRGFCVGQVISNRQFNLIFAQARADKNAESVD